MIKRALPAVRTRVEALRATAEVVGVDYPGPESMVERLDVRRVAGVRERAFPHALSGFPACQLQLQRLHCHSLHM